MPELPEVEVVVRKLRPHITGKTIRGVSVRRLRVIAPTTEQDLARALKGARFVSLQRRGKYLVVRFESGRVLLIHLRMTGNLLHGPRDSFQDLPHRRAVVTLDDGSDVAYRDVRRFGTWLLTEPGELDAYLARRVGSIRPG